MVVTSHGTSVDMTEVDIVRAGLMAQGFTASKPTDEWIQYYLKQGLGVQAIVEIAWGRPLTSRLAKYELRMSLLTAWLDQIPISEAENTTFAGTRLGDCSREELMKIAYVMGKDAERTRRQAIRDAEMLSLIAKARR